MLKHILTWAVELRRKCPHCLIRGPDEHILSGGPVLLWVWSTFTPTILSLSKRSFRLAVDSLGRVVQRLGKKGWPLHIVLLYQSSRARSCFQVTRHVFESGCLCHHGNLRDVLAMLYEFWASGAWFWVTSENQGPPKYPTPYYLRQLSSTVNHVHDSGTVAYLQTFCNSVAWHCCLPAALVLLFLNHIVRIRPDLLIGIFDQYLNTMLGEVPYFDIPDNGLTDVVLHCITLHGNELDIIVQLS